MKSIMLNKKNSTILSTLFLVGIIGFSFMALNYGIFVGYKQGIGDLAQLAGIDYSLTRNADDSYTLTVLGKGSSQDYHITCDLTLTYYQGGSLISVERHSGTLTNIGGAWIAAQISAQQASSKVNATYISVSADSNSGMSVSSTQLTNELDANGFTRATGAYTLTQATSPYTWTVYKLFTNTGSAQTVQLFGLQYSATKQTDNNLLCYDQSASAKNTDNGDTVAATFTLSIA